MVQVRSGFTHHRLFLLKQQLKCAAIVTVKIEMIGIYLRAYFKEGPHGGNKL